ncbi:Retrovirus-related Pol polyprotein from transposon TNT 1-94 [Sesamum angolense]|uniref:Retrovirus-related Pol polyprotein from transposon TNT 1-94 n=1 Tax=Sesamum angolense TaxID=2727404 RepID=A0AAE1W426_9LAMI|nr:Retrovirus-related Pol polyprotein from transposon TNT 1-94 [Sesamum angolense]
MINSLLLTFGLPKYLWGEALNTACHILNRVSLKHNTSTSFELWKGIEVNTIVKFRDAVFPEDVFPMKIGIPSSVSLDDSLTSTSIPEHLEKMTNVGVNPNSTNLTHEESNIWNVMASSKAKQWKEAVKSEMDSIVSNRTWMLVDLPPGCTTIGCKWIFKKKLKPNGTVDKFKARLVAKGFKQKDGIDYFDTYSPVSRLTTIRVLIALASVYNLSIHQMDVKTAFLYVELEEEIYMDQLEGFVVYGNERKVCKLVKSLYGLKQAPKQCIWQMARDQIFHFPSLSWLDTLVVLTKPIGGALDRVLRYLKGTGSLAIHYGRFPAILEGYSDASWIAKNSESNGCSGYVFTLGGDAVSWKSAKQTLITRSTFEA